MPTPDHSEHRQCDRDYAYIGRRVLVDRIAEDFISGNRQTVVSLDEQMDQIVGRERLPDFGRAKEPQLFRSISPAPVPRATARWSTEGRSGHDGKDKSTSGRNENRRPFAPPTALMTNIVKKKMTTDTRGW